MVMNLLLGLPFEAVSIKKIQQERYKYSNGQKIPLTYLVTEGVTWPKNRTESVNKNIMTGILDLREALASMAGPQAEAISVGKIDKDAQFGAQTDIQFIAACCRAAVAPGEPIADWKPTIMEEQILQAVALQAVDLLMQNWAGVESVANALFERKSLTYSEAEALFKTV